MGINDMKSFLKMKNKNCLKQRLLKCRKTYYNVRKILYNQYSVQQKMHQKYRQFRQFFYMSIANFVHYKKLFFRISIRNFPFGELSIQGLIIILFHLENISFFSSRYKKFFSFGKLVNFCFISFFQVVGRLRGRCGGQVSTGNVFLWVEKN